MDNTSKKLFKKSFIGGFKREDVAGYIADLSAEHARTVQELREELAASERRNAELQKANAELVGAKRDLTAKVDELDVKVSQGETAAAQLAALREEFATLTAEKEKLDGELLFVKNALQAAETKVEEYRAREAEISKSKEQIANLELDARNRSEKVEEETRARMAGELAEHKEYIEKKTRELEEYRQKTLTELETLVARMGDECKVTKDAVSDFKTGFKSVVALLARNIDSIADASVAIEDAFTALENDCKNMREGV